MTLIIAGFVILILWVYILFIRPILIVKYPDFGRFASWEQTLFQRSRSVLVGRMYQIGGWLLGLQTLLAASGVDTTPFTNELAKLIPDQYRPLAISLFMIITGIVVVKLRKMIGDSGDTAPKNLN